VARGRPIGRLEPSLTPGDRSDPLSKRSNPVGGGATVSGRPFDPWGRFTAERSTTTPNRRRVGAAQGHRYVHCRFAPGNRCLSVARVRTWAQGIRPVYRRSRPFEPSNRSAPVISAHARWPSRPQRRFGAFARVSARTLSRLLARRALHGATAFTGTTGRQDPHSAPGSPGTWGTCKSSRTASATSSGRSHIGTWPASGRNSSRPSGSASLSGSA
jgi:hypothetical protein